MTRGAGGAHGANTAGQAPASLPADAAHAAHAAHAGNTAGQVPANLPSGALVERASTLDWLLFDVDGVLTDGRLLYGADGEQWKVFDVRDGIGLKLAQRAGLKVGLLSGRESRALEARAQELGLDALIMHREDKAAAFGELLAARGITAARVAYMGDDLVDLPVLLACGLSFAPADAVADVRSRVDHVLSRPGGRGAVREMVELVLRARGAWDGLLAPYLRPAGGDVQGAGPLTKEEGVPILRTGQPLTAAATDEVRQRIREERDRTNRGDGT